MSPLQLYRRWSFNREAKRQRVFAAEVRLEQAIKRSHDMEKAHELSVLDGTWRPGDMTLCKLEAAHNLVILYRRELREARRGR